VIYLIILVIILSFIEIKRMEEKQQKKEIVVYLGLAVIGLALGFLYLSNPYRTSLAQHILSLIGQEF
jgi:multisubunit Na+/H+ antiporter MnhB subunit